MPDFAFTFTVRQITQQQAQNLQTRLTNQLTQAGASASSVWVGQVTRSFRVRGVDTTTGQVFDQTVDATDVDAATQQVTGGVATMVVVIAGQA